MDNEDFLKDLKWSIEETDRNSKKENKPSKTYKPSSMYCIRCMYYQMIGAELEPEQSDYCLINICNSGSDIHIRIQKAIEDMKVNNIDCEYIDVETYIKENNIKDIEVLGKTGMETRLHHTKLNMNFMCDGIIKYKGKYYILEIKTETSRKWCSRLGVDESHINQASAYSLSFNLPEVMFLYINRDFLDMKAYILNVSEEDRNTIINKINTCNNCIENNIVPDKPDIDKKKCKYCSYKNLCNSQ